MSHLVPCPECQRHVRVHESACPFCGGALALASSPPPRLPRTRLGRAALFAFGATIVGATAMGCSDDDDGGGTGGAAGTAGSGSGGTAGDDAGNAGTAGTGGGSAGTAGAAGFGGAAPAYGLPADDGGGAALYGAAP